MAKQSITAPVYPVNNVSSLPDIVTNQATTVKTTLDKASVDIKAYENTLIAELNGNDGSKKIGHSSMNVTSNNVGDAIEEVITAINGVVLGAVPNGSITDLKLGADNKIGSLASLGTTVKTSVVSAINEVKTQANGLSTNVATLSTDLNIIRTAKLTTGLVNVMAVDTDGTFDLTKNGNTLTIIPNLTTTSVTVTVAPDGQTAKLVKKANDIGNFVALDIGDLKKNTPTQLVWDSVSDFFIFAPKGGSNVKSIQRGTATISGASTTINVAVTSVDLTKSAINFTWNCTTSDTGSWNTTTPNGELTSATNLRFTRESAINSETVVIDWEIIEFNNVKSLQKGTKSFATTSDTIAITSVNTAKSIMIFNYSTTTGTSTFVDHLTKGILTNATTITLAQRTARSNNVKWQVVEFN